MLYNYLMIRRPPRCRRTDTLCPYTTLVRSQKRQISRLGRGAMDEAHGRRAQAGRGTAQGAKANRARSEEHSPDTQSLMRISYAVFCLKIKKLHLRHAYQIMRHPYDQTH